jgi:hypothetical protein
MICIIRLLVVSDLFLSCCLLIIGIFVMLSCVNIFCVLQYSMWDPKLNGERGSTRTEIELTVSVNLRPCATVYLKFTQKHYSAR